MSTADAFRRPVHLNQPEPAEARQRRLTREAEMIAEARADVAAGRVIPFEAIEAWIDSLGTANELPVPQPDR